MKEKGDREKERLRDQALRKAEKEEGEGEE